MKNCCFESSSCPSLVVCLTVSQNLQLDCAKSIGCILYIVYFGGPKGTCKDSGKKSKKSMGVHEELFDIWTISYGFAFATDVTRTHTSEHSLDSEYEELISR